MEKELFVEYIPFLYHLTDKRNLALIKGYKKLFSTTTLISMAKIENPEEFLTTRRPLHEEIIIKDSKIYIRDQRPLNRALDKCLTDDMKPSDFILHLNARVFMWPNLKRLWTHFSRYESENPIILRFDTSKILELNSIVELSRINSGATRPSGVFGGKAAPRGKGTFVDIRKWVTGPNDVAEVTFPSFCILPNEFNLGTSPEGKWSDVIIS